MTKHLSLGWTARAVCEPDRRNSHVIQVNVHNMQEEQWIYAEEMHQHQQSLHSLRTILLYSAAGELPTVAQLEIEGCSLITDGSQNYLDTLFASQRTGGARQSPAQRV